MFVPSKNFLSEQVSERLGHCWPKPDPAAVSAAMDDVFRLADQSWDAMRNSIHYLRTAPVAACAAGCGWCCHQQVGVSVPEAVRIAAHIAGLPDPDRHGFEERIATTDRRTRGLTTLQWAQSKVACAFLGVDGRCMIYSVRPLRCRGAYSIDRDFCIACYDDLETMRAKLKSGELKPVFLETPERIYDGALSGVLEVLARHAPKTALALEMIAAVHTLLRDPGLARRWLAGRAPDPALHLKPEGP